MHRTANGKQYDTLKRDVGVVKGTKGLCVSEYILELLGADIGIIDGE